MEKRQDTSTFDDAANDGATGNVNEDQEPDEEDVPDFVVTIFRTAAGKNKIVTIARCSQNQKAADEPRTLLVISRQGTDAAINEQIVAHGQPTRIVLQTDVELAAVAADEQPNVNVSALENYLAEKDEKEEKKKKKKNRCAECGKRVGLTAIVCRCEKIFCAFHRYSDRHNCNFDYRQMALKEIGKDNPVITGEKIQKI